MHDGAVVPYPAATNEFQYEVELVVAIGRGGSDILVENAESHIFGYAIGIDLTRRDLLREAATRGLPWEMGKSFDRSAPCGPIRRIEGIGPGDRPEPTGWLIDALPDSTRAASSSGSRFKIELLVEEI